MKRLIDAIIAKWFCLHEWTCMDVEITTGKPIIHHYKCVKCGKWHTRIDSYPYIR